MATISKQLLSGSTDGRAIKVAATATPGTVVHTAHATDTDEIWIYAMNTDVADQKLTVEWGGVTDPDDLIEKTIAKEGGLELIVPGLPLTNALVVRAFAAAANVITIVGFVNRIT